MDEPILAAAAEILRRSRDVAVPIDELATALRARGTNSGISAIERALVADPRFRVVRESLPLPGLDAWTPAERAAYAPAFRAAGLAPTPLVVLLERTPPPDCDALCWLVHDSLATLLQAGDAEGVTGAARRVARSLTAS